MDDFAHIKTIAAQWRQDNGYVDKGGVIIIYRDQVQGWVNELRDPSSWRPGCIAVDSDDNQWLAVGGNEYDGAAEWQAVDTEKVDITSLKAITALAQVDVQEIAQLRADAQEILALTEGCASLHVAAHRIFLKIDSGFPANPDAHKDALDRLEALGDRLHDSFSYLTTLYGCGCAEEYRKDTQVLRFGDAKGHSGDRCE